MSAKDTIDITSPLKNGVTSSTRGKKVAKNLFENTESPYNTSPKGTLDTSRQKRRFPLTEMEVSEEISNVQGEEKKTTSKKRKSRKRSKKKKTMVSPPFSKLPISFHKPESNLTTDVEKETKGNQNILEKVSPSFTKLVTRQEELKESIEKARQAYSAYKVSTFFCFNTEFIKNFGENLVKAELSIKTMSEILDSLSKQNTSKTDLSEDNDDIMCLSPLLSDDNAAKSEPIPPPSASSITPPSSEIGKEEVPLLVEEKSRSRKRKSSNRICTNEEEVVNPVTRKTRKCTVIAPLVTQVVKDTQKLTEKLAAEAELPVKVATGSDSDSDTKEGEYEVRKIKDYIRKPNGFYYRVSWRGYDSDEDTHEPADHLSGCEDYLVDFFCRRLKQRENITSAEGLRPFLLPHEEKVREYVYKAFEKMILPISKEMLEKGIKFISASKLSGVKSVKDVQDDILKFLTMRDPSLERYKKAYTSIIEQMSYKELYQDRMKQLADLRAWERSMNIISSDPAPLSVENHIDFELPPLNFVYINEYLPAPGIMIPSDPMAGCECKDCNNLQKGCCASQMGSYFAYNKYGRLRVSLGTPIYECNKMCKCPPDCTNRVVQNGRKVSLSIFRTSNNRGWGVKALEMIKKDQFVSEYVGEVISSEEAELRGTKYDTKGCTYLFDLDYNKGELNPYTVDAVKYGNVSHFINHSCDPNLVVYNVWVNCLDPDLPKLALFAARDIRKGEEISFDYNSGSTRQISIIDKMDEKDTSTFLTTPTKMQQDEDGEVIIPTTEFILKTPRNRVNNNAGKTRCKCGAANCRKFFF